MLELHQTKVARELFIKNGVYNVNMHQIAKTAGVGQASLYRRYSPPKFVFGLTPLWEFSERQIAILNLP
jgi:hypothetical protein